MPWTKAGLGWQPGLPDFRDYHADTPQVHEFLAQLTPSSKPTLPTAVDLREYCPPVDDQMGLNTSPALACTSLIEYFERRARGRSRRLSSMFLHQVGRRMISSDEISDLRTLLRAARRFGIPPSQYWPYDTERLQTTPDAFLYGFGDPFRSMLFVRLDPPNSNGADTLARVRTFLAAGFAVAFGFPVPTSLGNDAEVPFRPTFDSILGGQAVIAVGYDDRRLGASRGALLFRNSWGEDWGDGGYGWLPYRYVEQQLAVEFWTVVRSDWISSGEFRRPALRELATAP